MSEAIVGRARGKRLHPLWILGVLVLLFGVVTFFSGASLLHSFTEAMEEAVTIVVVTLLAVFAIVVFQVRRYGIWAAQAVEEAANKLYGYQTPDEQRDGLLPETLEHLKEVLPTTANRSLFGEQWQEFQESLVERGGRYFNTIEAGRFFTNEELEMAVKGPLRVGRVELGSVEYSFIHEIPGLMTSLGMLGTFVGIAIGLGQLSGLGNDAVAGQIGGVIEGLASAFWTSIFGLVGASIVIWLNHRSDSELEQSISHFRLQLDRCVPRATSEFFLEKQMTTGRLHTKALQELIGLQKTAIDALHSMAHDIAEGTGQKIIDHLGPLLQEVASIVREQVASASQRSETATLEMANALKDGLIGGLSETVGEIGKQTTAMAESFGQMAQHIDHSMGNAIERIESGLGQTTEKMTASFDTAMSSVDQRVGATVTALEQGLQRAGEGLASSMEGVVQHVTTQMAEVGSAAVAELQNASAEAAKAVRETINPLIVSLRAFGGVVQMLDAQAGKQGALLQAYEDASSAMTASAGALLPTIQSLRSSTEAQEGVARRIAAVTEGIVAASGKLTMIGSEIHGGLVESVAGLRQAAAEMTSLMRGFEGWIVTTRGALESFGSQMSGTVKATMTDYEASLTQALSGLASAAHGISEIADDIADRVDRRPAPPAPSPAPSPPPLHRPR